MRCCACDKALNDSEATRRVLSTGDFLDMCNKCYGPIALAVPTITREDLNPNEMIEEDWEKEYYEEETDAWGTS